MGFARFLPTGLRSRQHPTKKTADPTGVLQVPVVTIHSINDPDVLVEEESAYRDVVRAAGSGNRLVQAFTDEHEHSALNALEVGAALDELMRWIETGAKPTPQSIAAACEQLRASLDAPCSYHPGLYHSGASSVF